MKGKTTKLLEEILGEYLCDFGTGKDLLKKTPYVNHKEKLINLIMLKFKLRMIKLSLTYT